MGRGWWSFQILGRDLLYPMTTQDGKEMALQLEGVEKGLKPRLQGLQGSVAALAEHVYGCQELADKVIGWMN